MKAAVVCANGRVGSLVVTEAEKRGVDVTAIARGENRTASAKYLQRDLFDLTKADLQGFDVVVDAFGTWTLQTLPLHGDSLKHLCDILSGTDTRLLVVGGAGSLYMNTEHTVRVCDGPEFPEAYRPLAAAMAAALDELRTRSDVRWTYISPAADFRADCERMGGYLLGGEELILNARGESVISYADYAAALVDEMLNGRHVGKRISVVGR